VCIVEFVFGCSDKKLILNVLVDFVNLYTLIVLHFLR